MTESIETSEADAVDPTEAAIRAAGADKAPRVTPADIQAAIASEHYFTASQGVLGAWLDEKKTPPDAPVELDLVTFCVLVLHNGFTVVGKSAVASAENFKADIGRSVARNDAERQLWQLLGFRLRDRLAATA